jgi:cyanophycinase
MHKPLGRLIAVGGAEDKGTDIEPNFPQKHYLNFFEFGILSRILSEMAKGKNSHIEVITTASMIPEEVGENYIQAFKKLGCETVGLMHIKNRADVQKPEYQERLLACDGIMFTGGNQLRLSSIFGGTEFGRTLERRYEEEEDFVIAGTSAGAMAMSSTMIYQGSSGEALLKGEVKITTGLGLVSDVIIDTHFVKRGRFGRLAQAVVSNPRALGIGLGDDTGVLISQGGTRLETIGSGLVVLVDGTTINQTNLTMVDDNMPISIEGLTVHVMAKGDSYDIQNRRFILAEPLVSSYS